MDFNSLTIRDIITFIVGVGIICGFFYKLFSFFQQVNTNKDNIERLGKKIQDFKEMKEADREELVKKIDETNSAVNLLCSAISALIDNEITENGNLEELKRIKQKLDDKKELV